MKFMRLKEALHKVDWEITQRRPIPDDRNGKRQINWTESHLQM